MMIKMLFFQIYPKSTHIFSLRIFEGRKSPEGITFCLSKKIYAQDIKKHFPEHADLLISLQWKMQKGKGVSFDTMYMQELILSEEVLAGVLRKLSNTNSICYGKKLVQINIFYDLECFFRKEQEDKDTIVLSSICKNGPHTFSLHKCLCIHPRFCIYQNTLSFFKEDIERKWTPYFKDENIILHGREKKRFIEDFGDKILEKHTKECEPIPVVILQDSKGMFANLYGDYEGTLVNIFDENTPCVRQKKQEELLLLDMQDAGYEIKKIGKASFYCSQPNVYNAIELLVGIGWQVLNKDRKKIVLEQSCSIKIMEEKQNLQLKGKITFSNGQSIDLQKTFSSLQRGDSLLEVGSSVGLINPYILKKKIAPFVEKNQSFLPTTEIGLLSNASLECLDPKLDVWKRFISGDKKLPKVEISSSFQGTLLPYQEIGYRWLVFLYENNFFALLADEMGLGKTIQVLAFFSYLRKFFPVLIVVPKSLLSNWIAECKRFLPDINLHTYYGTNRTICKSANSFILTTYGVLRQDVEKLSAQKFSCIVLDESTHIKNNNSQGHKAACQLSADFKICLNGTPIENCYEELIHQFHFLQPGFIKKKTPQEQIKKKITPFLLQRTKEEVEIDLPEKIEQVVWLTMDKKQKEAYTQLLSTYQKQFPDLSSVKEKKMHVFTAILRLRQFCLDPQLIDIESPSVKLIQLLEDLSQIAKKHKVLIFSQFVKVLQYIHNLLEEKELPILYLDGRTSISQRAEKINLFQNSIDPLTFLISTKAGGHGLNLQSADYVFLFDPWWNEAVEAQAIGRAHRIGRKNTLFIKKYLLSETIEEKIYQLQKTKTSAAQDFIPHNLLGEDLLYLLS